MRQARPHRKPSETTPASEPDTARCDQPVLVFTNQGPTGSPRSGARLFTLAFRVCLLCLWAQGSNDTSFFRHCMKSPLQRPGWLPTSGHRKQYALLTLQLRPHIVSTVFGNNRSVGDDALARPSWPEGHPAAKPMLVSWPCNCATKNLMLEMAPRRHIIDKGICASAQAWRHKAVELPVCPKESLARDSATAADPIAGQRLIPNSAESPHKIGLRKPIRWGKSWCASTALAARREDLSIVRVASCSLCASDQRRPPQIISSIHPRSQASSLPQSRKAISSFATTHSGRE